MHDTGTGKTIAAISIAMNFINVYSKIWKTAVSTGTKQLYSELHKQTPTIFVLGFGPTRTAFQRDLLKYPEFGFISVSEREESIKLEKLAAGGLPDDIKHYKEFMGMLRRRITNKSTNGFFQFYGYDEFVNRLFSSETVKLTDIEEEIAKRQKRGAATKSLEEVIADHIEAGTIQVNTGLLAQFENSLLICDEIHNTYNMHSKNNRGIALQYVLDMYPRLRAVTMSATPINNSPTEVVELLNYLVPPSQKITKRDLFINNRELRENGYEIIERMSRGRISFLQDSNIQYFPTKTHGGQPMVLREDVEGLRAGMELPYLRFIECPMSELHQATWDSIAASAASEAAASEAAASEAEADITGEDIEAEAEDIDTSASSGPRTAVPPDGAAIHDMVLPAPPSENGAAAPIGIFRSRHVSRINLAPQKWRDEVGIALTRQGTISNVIVGQLLSRERLPTYSIKYSQMLEYILKCMRETAGDITASRKLMVYHNRVKMSGVLIIQEIMRTNGFIDEWSEPTDGTLCALCGRAMSEHNDKAVAAATAADKTATKSAAIMPHQFFAARFVIGNHYVDKSSLDNSRNKFNAPSNVYGTEYLLMIGSSIIKEGYDFKDVQELLVMSSPVSIPALIQVFGRVIRKNSHENLPPSRRRVTINIFVSTVNPKYPAKTQITPEVYRYADKLLDYQVIQHIEYILNRGAVDGDIHRSITMPDELAATYFAPGQERTEANAAKKIGNLYFEPTAKVRAGLILDDRQMTIGMAGPGTVNTTTFTAYNHSAAEIDIITVIIKRSFLRQPVWKYEDLWAVVRCPPFGIEVNPGLFSEYNFVIALSQLVAKTTDIIHRDTEKLSETALMLKVFDGQTRDIYRGNRRYRITQVGEYYILFPMGEVIAHPLAMADVPLEHVRDKNQAVIREMTRVPTRQLIDVETYLRLDRRQPGVLIDVASFVQESKSGANYASYRATFIAKYAPLAIAAAGDNAPISIDLSGALTDYSASFQASIIEEAIEFAALGRLTGNSASLPVAPPELYNAIITYYSRFGIIILLGEVRKYKDTAKQFLRGIPQMPDDTPLGYVRARSVRLFDPQIENLSRRKLAAMEENELADIEARWFDINKLALNRHTSFRENTIIVGYLEAASDETLKFKLRKPSQMIKANLDREIEMRRMTRESGVRMTIVDTRLVERGIVCTTKSKRELLHICSQLKIHISDTAKVKIKTMCELIKAALLASEAAERRKDSKIKYLYGWWDELPSLV